MKPRWCNDHDMELSAYFGGAYESALGLRAAALEPSGQSDPSGKLPPPTARQAHKDMSLVEAALHRLAPDVVRVLALRYAPRKLAHFDGLSEFGEHARVALATPTAIAIGAEWRDKAKETELDHVRHLYQDEVGYLATADRSSPGIRARYDRPPTIGEIQEGLRFLQRTKRSGTNAETIKAIIEEAKKLWVSAKGKYARARSGAKDDIDEDEVNTEVAKFRRRLGL